MSYKHCDSSFVGFITTRFVAFASPKTAASQLGLVSTGREASPGHGQSPQDSASYSNAAKGKKNHLYKHEQAGNVQRMPSITVAQLQMQTSKVLVRSRPLASRSAVLMRSLPWLFSAPLFSAHQMLINVVPTNLLALK